MARKTALIKMSGSLYHRDDVLKWIKKITKDYFTVICVGGGRQINEAFLEHGLELTEHSALGRETKNFNERQLARDTLEKNQAKLQDLLETKKISASVIIPVLDIGTVLCHVNGDIFALAAHHGFDKIYIVTAKGKSEKKREDFAPYPKIEVVEFPPEPKN